MDIFYLYSTKMPKKFKKQNKAKQKSLALFFWGWKELSAIPLKESLSKTIVIYFILKYKWKPILANGIRVIGL